MSEARDLKQRAAAGAGPFTDSTQRIEVRRLIPASPAEIFEAWRDPQIMKLWYFPGDDWSSHMVHDFEVGGRYNLEMTNTGGERFLHTGVYREIAPPDRLVFTWSTPFVEDSLVTVLLTEQNDDTLVTIVHEFPAGVNVEMPRLHNQGWTGTLDNMARVFSD